MSNPYKTPESQLTPKVEPSYIGPLMVAMVVVIHVCYVVYYYLNTDSASVIGSIKAHSFSIFTVCTVAYWAMIMNIKIKMDAFSLSHPAISDNAGLEKLKTIIRMNMYCALVAIVMLPILTLTGVMAILPFEGIKSLMVLLLGVGTSAILQWAKNCETKVKNIQSLDNKFEQEIKSLIHCWFHKALPDF